jgi:hypothetical protein
MKSWLLALAVLLGGAVSMSYGDYIIIKYKLSVNQEKNPSGAEGMPPGAGLGGPPGVGLEPPGQGLGQQPGRMSGSGAGSPRPGGSGAFSPPPGSGSFAPPPGTFGGPGGFGTGTMPPGQATGQEGGPEEVVITPLYVLAVVELSKPLTGNDIRLMIQSQQQLGSKRIPIRISHKWGSTLLAESDVIAYLPMAHGAQPEPSAVATFKKKSTEVHLHHPGPDDLVEHLAAWALSHGLIAEFHKVMDEVVQAKADHPVAVAYTKAKAALERPAAANPDVATWKAKLGMEAYKAASNKGGHYTLLHNAGSNESTEVQGRLSRLENAFQSFYYWFALRERADRVQVPDKRLLAVLVGRQSEERDFNRMHQIFGAPPLVTDGFYARRDNLVIFSSVPRDEAFEDVRSVAERNFKGTDPSVLLRGRGDDYNGQTLALVLKALEEDNEASAVSQEGPRQLLAAASLLPRNVAIPQWTQFGMGSFFGTPPGSPWPTLGAPGASLLDNNNYLYTYQTWLTEKKLDTPKTALEKVVTDQYFRVAKDTKDPAAVLKSRTMAWALTFFLANKKLDGLLRYFEELSKLPRDLQFDDPVLLLTFARAFDLIDARNPDRIDQAKLEALANDWQSYLKKTPLEVAETIKQVHKMEVKSAQQGGAAGQNPYGGPPGAGGGVPPGGLGRPGGG